MRNRRAATRTNWLQGCQDRTAFPADRRSLLEALEAHLVQAQSCASATSPWWTWRPTKPQSAGKKWRCAAGLSVGRQRPGRTGVVLVQG